MPLVGSTDLPRKSPSSTSGPLKPFSLSFSSKSNSTIPKPHHPHSKKRPHSSLGEDESDHDDAPQQPQLVSGFDLSAGGAIGANGAEEKKEHLVIRGQKNRDWREESRRKKGKNLLPAEVQAARSGQLPQGNRVVEMDKTPKTFGLNFVKRDEEHVENAWPAAEPQVSGARSSTETFKSRDFDQEALKALTSDGAPQSSMIISTTTTSADEDLWKERANEDHAFRSDVASRPDSATLDEYAAVPVEEFGKALMRGMGWKEGGVVGKGKSEAMKPREVAPRPALLGIGAKEVPGSVEELGAWGKAVKGKRKKDLTYNPVMLKNSVTGEMVTEEELEAKKAEQRQEGQDWRERRDRNLALDQEKKHRRKLDNYSDERGHSHSRLHSRKSHGENRHDSSRRDRGSSFEHSRYSSSCRDRSKSPVSSRHSSSRRERNRSTERRHKRRGDHDHDNDFDMKYEDRYRDSKGSRYEDCHGYDRNDQHHKRKHKYRDEEDYRSSGH